MSMIIACNRFQASGSASDLSASDLADFIASCCRLQPDEQLALDVERILPVPAEATKDGSRASDWSSELRSTSWLDDFKTENRTATHLILQFGSAGAPPEENTTSRMNSAHGDDRYRHIHRRLPDRQAPSTALGHLSWPSKRE
jgi:hypothetical protein